MYRKDSTGWIKHVDFIILDLICLQVAFVLAYVLSGYGANPYQLILYRNMAVFMEVADLVVLFAMGTLKNVLKRGYYKDFVVTAQHMVSIHSLWEDYNIAGRSGGRKVNLDSSYSCNID